MFSKTYAAAIRGIDAILVKVEADVRDGLPGLELVGPAENFGFFSDFSKYVLMFDMLAGRLELFPLLLLFHPSIWKDLFAYKMSQHSNRKK